MFGEERMILLWVIHPQNLSIQSTSTLDPTCPNSVYSKPLIFQFTFSLCLHWVLPLCYRTIEQGINKQAGHMTMFPHVIVACTLVSDTKGHTARYRAWCHFAFLPLVTVIHLAHTLVMFILISESDLLNLIWSGPEGSLRSWPGGQVLSVRAFIKELDPMRRIRFPARNLVWTQAHSSTVQVTFFTL